MVTIFGTTYYTIGTGLVVLVLLAPLLYSFSHWLLRPNIEGKSRRTRLLAEGGATFGLLLLAAVGLYWDVYLIGQRAKELCEQTGLVVYRTAAAEGFLGSSAIDVWARHGFRYVETDHYGKLSRYEITDGQVITTPISTLQSSFAVRSVSPVASIRLGDADSKITHRTYQVVETSSGAILSELRRATIDYGWIDRLWINLTGFSANPRTCGRTRDGRITTDRNWLNVQDLVLTTLKPN